MDYRKTALALGLATSMSFASVSISFYGASSEYTSTNAKFESDQTSWASWSKENGYVKTTITGSKFSSGLTVTQNEKCDGYLTGIVNYDGNCGSKSLAAYGYYSGNWFQIGAFSSGQALEIDCDYSKIAFQAQTSSTKECYVNVNSITIGSPNDIIVTKVNAGRNVTDYIRSNDTIYYTVPFSTQLDKYEPTFSGIFSSVTPSTAQDFTNGPVTYTFSPKSGTATKDIVLNISQTPGDTNAALANVYDFCSKAGVYRWNRTYSNSPVVFVTKSDLAKDKIYCTEGATITRPQNPGDTGLVELKLYKWVPDSIRTKMYGRYSDDSRSEYAGLEVSDLATKNWYKDGKLIDVNLFTSSLDLENSVLEIVAQNKEPHYFYKFKFIDIVEETNYLSKLYLIDTLKHRYYYPRTIFDPESPKDTGTVIYDLPYNATVASKLFACGTGKSYYEYGMFSNCENTFTLGDTNSVLTVSGKMSGTSGIYATVSKDYDKKTYALKIKKQSKSWPDYTVSGMYVVDFSVYRNPKLWTVAQHFSVITAKQGATALKYDIPMTGKKRGNNDEDFDIFAVSTDPFAYSTYEPADYNKAFWDEGSIVKVTVTNEDKQRRILTATITHEDAMDVAELRSFYVTANGADLPAKIDQENRIVNVEVPFELNLKRVPITFGGPHKSYSENFENFNYYDLSDTTEFDIHSADSSNTAIYKIVVTYNPDMYKADTGTEPGNDSSETSLPKILNRTNATVKLVGNSLIYKGDIREVRALSVYDALGNKVYSRVGMNSPVVDLGHLNQGFYVIKIQSDRGIISSRFTKK